MIPQTGTIVRLASKSIRQSYSSLVNQTTPSAALDVLHHQHAEGGVWPLWHGFCDPCWNVNMTNQIQARAVIRNFECTWSRDQSVVIKICM